MKSTLAIEHDILLECGVNLDLFAYQTNYAIEKSGNRNMHGLIGSNFIHTPTVTSDRELHAYLFTKILLGITGIERCGY